MSKAPKIAPELLDLAERSRTEPEVSCACANPDAAYQQLWKHFRHEAASLPLLFAGRPGGFPKISADPANRMITLRWPNLSTEVEPAPKPTAKHKTPKWLEKRLAGYRETQVLAAASPEYRLAWMDLDTLIIACERLDEILTAGGEDADLEKYVTSASPDYMEMAFRGVGLDPPDRIELMRRQIAEIPIDDEARSQERLELIKRREALMLERDKRLEGTDPLI